ncbi:unnamed protein product, partial [Phaeothamnion confervicola]
SDGSPAPSNVIPTSGVLLIEPAAAIGGMLAVYLLFTAMNLASLVLLFLVLRRTFDDVVCALTIAVVGLTVPLAWHAAAIWSEVPALLAISIALLLAPRVGCSPRAATGVALALAALPWLHQKYMPLAFGLGVAMLLVRERRRLWWIVMA